MAKLPMYIIMSATMGLGGYLPVLFGADMMGGWSIFGTIIGGILGIYIYSKLRKAGYLE